MLPPATIRKIPLALLLVLVASTDARILPSRSKQVKVYSYVLPAGAEEIRDDINHSFACGNRSDGFYVDIDNDCQIFHRCQDRTRFSFICAERTVFSQMYQTCVHDGQLGYPCEDSVQYYPEGEGYEPSAAGSEPAEEEASQPEAGQEAAPVEELAAQPQPPSKSSEMVMAPAESTSAAEATNEVEPSQDNTQLSAEQTVDRTEEMKDEAEQEQQDAGSHYQVNADLFDSVEDESELPSENSAQEVLDEAELAVAPSAVPTEVFSADSTSQEDTQEGEVLDDITQVQQEDKQPQDEQAQDITSDVAPTSESSDSTQAGAGVLNADLPVQVEAEAQESVPATPEDLFTHSVHGEEAHYSGDALLNAVQTVEELEPIVHDLIIEHADPNELLPQVAKMAQDSASPAKVDAMGENVNEVLPELDTAPADMEATPLAQSTAAVGSSEGDESVGADAQQESAVESVQQVNELSPAVEAGIAADAADDSSETVVNSALDATDSDEPEQLASEPEAADVKPESIDDAKEVEANSFFSSENRPTADEQQQQQHSVADVSTSPLEIPAFVEEMAPLRPSDSADLPELIVSTEFHLDTATQGPAIRRRKTFLFRADAIRSRQ